jgi:hypothetical protein
MTFTEVRIVTGSAESDDGLGQGSQVEVRVNPDDQSRSFSAAMDDIWRNVQGAMRSAGFHWSEDSMDAWVETKAQENRAKRGDIF